MRIQGILILEKWFLKIIKILRKSYLEMSQEKLKNIHYFKRYSKFKKALNFCILWQYFR